MLKKKKRNEQERVTSVHDLVLKIEQQKVCIRT